MSFYSVDANAVLLDHAYATEVLDELSNRTQSAAARSAPLLDVPKLHTNTRVSRLPSIPCHAGCIEEPDGDAAESCPTVIAPHPTCKSPQECANQCASYGYLIGYCEVYDGEFGDCVCVKCPNAVPAGIPALAPASSTIAVAILVYFLLATNGSGNGGGGNCSAISRSNTFKGDCNNKGSSVGCAGACRGEGYADGYCFTDVADPDHRVCTCTRPCSSSAAVRRMARNAANAPAPCPTFPAPDTNCKSPQTCANQCADNGYLIGFCEVHTWRLGDCVCVKCPNAQLTHADHLALQSAVGEAKTCEYRSQTFKGICIHDDLCDSATSTASGRSSPAVTAPASTLAIACAPRSVTERGTICHRRRDPDGPLVTEGHI
uniref:Knottins-like domain-containing protein n=1 Tax=Leersia perrieri TaxID=77586 RepID=A0A0D9VCR2_9ORYZ